MRHLINIMAASVCYAPETDNGGEPVDLDTFWTNFWSPPQLVEAEMLEPEQTAALVAKSKTDPHFAEVSTKLRKSFDDSRKKATRTPENLIEGNYFQLVASSGPDAATGLLIYQKKRSAAEATVPVWATYLFKTAMVKAEDAFVAEINRLVGTEEGRKQTLAGSTGLPDDTKTYEAVMLDSGRYQVNYIVSERQIIGPDGKKFGVAFGFRNDVHRPINEKKAAETAAKAAADAAAKAAADIKPADDVPFDA